MQNLIEAWHAEMFPGHIAPQEVLSNRPLGTAKWGEPQIEPWPLSGVWLGRLTDGNACSIQDDRHVLIASGSRSGKGVSVLIPNLCLWPGSVVVIDPKGENAMVTARRRGRGSAYCHGMGQVVRLLDPFKTVQTQYDDFEDLRATFNPLDLIKPDRDEAIDDASRITEALIVSEQSKEPFWDDSAKGLMKAIILHVTSWPEFQPEDRTLITVRRLLMEGDQQTRALLRLQAEEADIPPGLLLLFEQMQRNPAFGGLVASAGERFAHMETTSPRTLASIVQVACTNTEFIDSPAMRRCLGGSAFALEELKTDANGQSLYICLPQRYMETHFRWLRMMTALVVTEMERVPFRPASGAPVLMVLDEFASLKRMKTIENAAAQIAGFGVKMMIVAQTLPQLKDIYRDNWETFVANAGVKLFFGNDDHFTRDYASKLIGDCEVFRRSESRSNTRGESSSESKSNVNGWSKSVSFTRNWGSAAGRGGSTFSNGGSTTETFGSSGSSSRSETHGTSTSRTEGWTESVHKRALVSPDEIGRVFGDRNNPTALALISGRQPIFIHRKAYYGDPQFEGLFDPHRDHNPPPTLEQRARMWEWQALHAAQAEQQRIAQEQEAARLEAEAEAERARRRKIRRRIIIGLSFAAVMAVIEGVSLWYLTTRYGCSWKCLLVPFVALSP